MPDYTNSDHWEHHYNVMVGIRYHMSRKAFYDSFHRLVGIASLALSSAAVATIASSTGASQVMAATVAILQCVDLIVNTKHKSELHADLRRRYLLLESDILAGRGTESEWLDRIKQIEIDEPPIKKALMLACQIDVETVSHGKSEHEIGWFRNLTKNWFAWS